MFFISNESKSFAWMVTASPYSLDLKFSLLVVEIILSYTLAVSGDQ